MLQEILGGRTCFAPGVHTELRAQLNRVRGVNLQDGSMVGNIRRDTSGVSARVYRNGVYGFSSMAELDPDAVRAVVQAATDNAAFMDRHIQKGKPAAAVPGDGTGPAWKEPEDPAQKTFVEAAREVDAYVAAKYPGLSSRMVSARSDSIEKVLCVSDGWSAHTVIPREHHSGADDGPRRRTGRRWNYTSRSAATARFRRCSPTRRCCGRGSTGSTSG